MKILFISHDASRTGAPLLLFSFIKWLRDNRPDCEMDIVILKNGSLIKQLREMCSRVFCWTGCSPLKAGSSLRRNMMRLKNRICRRWFLREFSQKSYDLVYVNSAAACGALESIGGACKGAKVLIHIHELENVLQACGSSLVDKWLARADVVVGVSDMVIQNLIEKHGAAPEWIMKVPAFVPRALSLGDGKDVRKQIGASDYSLLVGGCGTLEWRKGPDLFLQVARKTFAQQPALDVHFVWLGGSQQRNMMSQLVHDVDQCGLAGRVHFIGSVESPDEYYSAFDLFVMPSREDPFPLVCLEAGQAGCPIVCFENAIGSTEYLNNETGAVVPYMDTDAMSEAVIRLAEDSDVRRCACREIKKAVEPFNLSACAEKLMAIIDHQLQL